MVRLLHLSDLHLGWIPSFLEEEKQEIRRKERDSLLRKAVDLAISQGVHLVLIVGDLFQVHNPDEALVGQVKRDLLRLEEAGITVVTVPGNHDEISYHNSVYSKGNWPGLLVKNPTPSLVLEKDFQGSKVFLYSLAYTGGLTPVSDLGPFPRKEEEGIHIGAFHGTLDTQFLGERSLPIKGEDLVKASYHYVALGHLHQFQEKNLGNTLAVYAGAVESKGFSDLGVGFFTLVNFQGEQIEIIKVPIEVRSHKKVKIESSTKDSFEELLEEFLLYAHKDRLVQFTLTGTPPFKLQKQYLEETLKDSFFHVEVKDETDYLDMERIKRYKGEHTIRGYFVEDLLTKWEEAEDEQEKKILKLALLKGLAALGGGEVG